MFLRVRAGEDNWFVFPDHVPVCTYRCRCDGCQRDSKRTSCLALHTVPRLRTRLKIAAESAILCIVLSTLAARKANTDRLNLKENPFCFSNKKQLKQRFVYMALTVFFRS